MIDISSEKVVSLVEATCHLPRRRQGKRPNVATIYRWSQNGVRGIVLETIQVGGTRCTSIEAIQRFCDRLTNPVACQPAESAVARTRRRERQEALAEKECSDANL